MERRRSGGKSAFTLIELLIVVAIIGILIALLIPTFNGFRERTMREHCVNNLKSIHGVLRQYALAHDGQYPRTDHYYGSKFSAQYFNPQTGLNIGVWTALRPVQSMIRYGGSARVFFCPFHVNYDQNHWQPNSWISPIIETNSSTGAKTARVDFGYTVLINRGNPSAFQDGRISTRMSDHPDNLPLVADDLHFRLNPYDNHRPGSWWHGGGRATGVFNSDCNTLLGNGTVVSLDWPTLEEQGPGLIIGSNQDAYWFYLGHDNILK